MNTDEIDNKLAEAQERLKAAMNALAPKHKGEEWEEFEVASADVLTIERELAYAKGEEYADISDFPIKWDIGAPMPHIVANEHQRFLIFYAHEPEPNWDGTYITVKDSASSETEKLALVEFTRCASFRLGTPNDEVLHGHRLHGRGLDSHTAQIVKNSRWIAELEAINKVHFHYREEYWRKLTHYIFWFHDSTFECVAESYQVEIHHTSVFSLLTEACRRLVK